MSISISQGQWEHEQVVFCHDKRTKLRAIIAIHDTTLGPSLGGCRFWDYKTEEEALFDVLRLSRGMTYKAAVAGLSLGGGKSVIIGDPKTLKSEEFFKVFGRFVQSLAGRYITAEDVNIKVQDINIVASETSYVSGTNNQAGGSGDPSPVTAIGVFSGIKASVKKRFDSDSLDGVKIAVQGCGAVGYHLCELLSGAGAKLVISDLRQDVLKELAQKTSAKIVNPDDIHKQDVDIFSPCALGASINKKTIPEIRAVIIAGAANNQLLDEVDDMSRLEKKNILYAPDYVINAGGLINVYHELKGYKKESAFADANKIYDTLLDVFNNASSAKISTIEASNKIAEDRIYRAREKSNSRLKNSYDNQDWIKRKGTVC